MPRPISVFIHSHALQHNLQHVRQHLQQQALAAQSQPAWVWAVIKANAYGHGLPVAIKAFAQADGLAMLDFKEALACRDHGWHKPIMLLEGFFEAADVHVAAQYHLTCVIHSWHQIELLEALSTELPAPLAIMLKLNTGMNRLGFMPSDYVAAFARLQRLQQQRKITQLGKMTHFAQADESSSMTQEQMDCFMQTTQDLPGPISVCNSAATLRNDIVSQCIHSEQWVRPGICLYGSSPFAHQSAEQLGLLAAQSLCSEIIAVQQVPAGHGIGYGHRFIAPQAMRVGVVACGYADGYPRHAPSGTPVQVANQRTRLVGRVSMDMLVVDLSHLPQATVGSKVVLWGQDGPSVDEVAQASDTIGYELLCAVAPRVPRIIIPL